jgi:ribose transport system permease protein
VKTAVLRYVPLLLLAAVLAVFGALAEGFFASRNMVNIVVQASSLAIVATGMTLVLLTAGIDLSVGSLMFLAAAIAGKLVLGGMSLLVAVAAVLVVGVAGGMVNAAVVTRLGVPAFIATLGTLYAMRGVALYVTKTRAMNLPEELLRLVTTSFLGIPGPVWLLAFVAGFTELALRRSPGGRQIYAVGHSREQAERAGVNVRRITASVYVFSGLLATLGGLVAVAQLGAVSPTFGTGREFAAIAAAVLGGTSLFGGRGQVLPGTLIGALLIQSVETGLVMLNADPYLYPLVMAAIIFVAVLLDSIRTGYLRKLGRRTIRPLARSV